MSAMIRIAILKAPNGDTEGVCEGSGSAIVRERFDRHFKAETAEYWPADAPLVATPDLEVRVWRRRSWSKKRIGKR